MKKPNLKIVPNQTDLTPKQRKFVDLIIKGKHTYKDAYCEVYDVKMKKDSAKVCSQIVVANFCFCNKTFLFHGFS